MPSINYTFFAFSFRWDDQVFNRVIKREIIDATDNKNDDQIYNSFIKQEIIDETNYHNNDNQLLRNG